MTRQAVTSIGFAGGREPDRYRLARAREVALPKSIADPPDLRSLDQ
jgi:hypothetical protein